MSRIGWPLQDKEGGEGGGGGGDTHDYTAEASTMGWFPKEKWSGDPDKWVDAKTFVERGKTVLPIVLKRAETAEAKVTTLEGTVAQMQKDMAAFRELTEKAREREKKEFETKYQEALERRAEAVQEGDGKKFAEADDDIRRIEREAKDAVKETKQETKQDVHPDYPAWLAKNQWYVNDRNLQMEANIIYGYKVQDGLKGKALFEAIEKEVKSRHPDIFREDTRGTIVETREDGGGPSRETQDRTRGNGKSHVYENLPPDAKAACDRYIRQGWITGKDLAEKRAKYCADYDWS